MPDLIQHVRVFYSTWFLNKQEIVATIVRRNSSAENSAEGLNFIVSGATSYNKGWIPRLLNPRVTGSINKFNEYYHITIRSSSFAGLASDVFTVRTKADNDGHLKVVQVGFDKEDLIPVLRPSSKVTDTEVTLEKPMGVIRRRRAIKKRYISDH